MPRASRKLRAQLVDVGIFRRNHERAGQDFSGEVGALLALQEAGGGVAVFGAAGGDFVGTGGTLGVVARWGQRDVVVRLGEQAGDGVLREPGGIAVRALLGEAEEGDRLVREGVARFALGAGFHLGIRPGEHFAHAAADEIGDGDWRGGMDVADERITPHHRSSRLVLVARSSSIVNTPPMSHLHHQHQHLACPQRTHQPIVADPVSPQPGQVSAQRFPEPAGVVFGRDPVVQATQNLPLRLHAEFLQFLQRAFLETIDPPHASPPQR